jgi:septal ring factor EnvC (AmiA/AmiB activator)
VNENFIPLFLSGLSLSGVIITALFVYLSSQRSGQAINQIAEASVTMLDPLEKRLLHVEEELTRRDEIIKTLREQIQALGVELEQERRKRHDLEIRVDTLEEEKAGLISENGRLKVQLEKQAKRGTGL